MPAQLIGAHMSTSGGIGNALRNGKEIGCTAVQVFTSSPRQWKSKEITDAMVADYKKAVAETGISDVVSHDSYLINLSAPDDEIRAKSYAGLKGEIGRCAQYGIRNVVSHMGAHKGEGTEIGLHRVAVAALEILADTDDSVTILMETTAGQGSDLNSRFEEIARILDLTKGPERLCVCLDTCHIFVAGYDIRTRETYEHTFSEFDRLVGIDRLRAIHCNDTKKTLGSHSDRHDHIGEGEIGAEAFRMLVNDPRFERVPILLETPGEGDEHAMNLARLWSYTK